MREKDWLVKVLEEASERVEAWPEWKKSSELQQSQQCENNDREHDEVQQQRARCA